MKLMVPTIHMNGSSPEELYRQLSEANTALCKALYALANASPNGRDYYPQGDDAIKLASDQHRARVNKLVDVRNEMETIGEEIAHRLYLNATRHL